MGRSSKLKVRRGAPCGSEAWTCGAMRTANTNASEPYLYDRQLLDSVGDGICSIDCDGKMTFANPAAARILGHKVDELIGAPLHETVHAARPDGSPYPVDDCPICRPPRNGPTGVMHAEVFWSRSGDPVSVEVTCTPIRAAERTVGAVLCFRDVTDQKWLNDQVRTQIDFVQDANWELTTRQADLADANARLEEANLRLAEANSRLALLATTDGLTDLKNHRGFHERLGEEVLRTKRYENPLSLLLLDVDLFKQFNDMFGHPEGDAVLRAVASLVRDAVRNSDLAARYGGEEFAVILPETDAAAARIAAERVRVAIEQAPWRDRAVTVSVGAATFSDTMESGEDLVTHADRALYRSKQRGRNCCTHAADPAEEFDFRGGNSLPYTDIMHEMLGLQNGLLTSAAERVKERLIDAYDKTIESWRKILDMKDKETEGHSTRVTNLTTRLARSIAMNEEEVLYARWGALLHDIGKIGIPDSILLKPGPLTEEEWIVMRRHPVIAYEMLSPITFLRAALDIPYGHHEKWDGTGYPRGLEGEEIPIAARLFAVVDVYDALRSDRPYRRGWPEQKVREYLREQAGSHFDPRAVDAFLNVLKAEQTSHTSTLKRAA